MGRYDVVVWISTRDMNGDGEVNLLDINPFVAALTGGAAVAVPEPGATGLLLVGVLGLVWRR